MTYRQRIPYVFLLALCGALLAASAWRTWMRGDYLTFSVNAAATVTALVATAVLALRKPGSWVPEWARRFETVAVQHPGGGPPVCVLRCNRCDATVLPSAPQLTLPRQLTYAHVHATLACDPRRATDPEDTRRIGPEKQRRGLIRP